METVDQHSILNTHDLLNLNESQLSRFFNPKSIALVGASGRKGSVGRATFENLLNGGFKGKIYPINATHSEILGHKAYATILEIPEVVDLLVVTIPAAATPAVIQQAVDLGVPAAVIISAGFKEVGPAGLELENQILKISYGKMRIIGPNCLGLMNPNRGLNATFAQTIANPGNVAFISQSGALCTAILDWSLQESFGFSGFVSTGSMADVGWGDLIDYFGADESTKSIVIYMESIGDAQAFLSAAREVSLNKPIIVIKAGRTAAAAKAAASHTGSLTGSDDVLDAAFRRCGVLRVNEISEVFYMADILGKQSLPKGRRLAIVTNAGGPGVLATDALITGGGELAQLSPTTMAKLDQFLPAAWSHNNPIDILGDAEPSRYAKTLKEVVDSNDSDGILVITTPQGMTNPLDIAKELIPYAKKSNKPILAAWMGGDQVLEGTKALNQAGVPTFPFPDAATSAFNYMWQTQQNLKMLYETPVATKPKDQPLANEAAASLQKIRNSGRQILSEYESKMLLEKYGIPIVPTRLATTAEEAVKCASAIGFPVVVKIHSETITHKSDVGGVILNITTEAGVREAFLQIQKNVQNKAKASDFLGVTVQKMVSLDGYELILGSSIDPQFGPVLLFGLGGQLVEVFRDHALALPPLTNTLARQLMEQTKIFKALLGVRGHGPVDLLALEKLLVRFSELILNHPEISELDINPLIVSETNLVAVDARVVLHSMELKILPKPAIRPYPIQYSGFFQLKNAESVLIRPIRPEDEIKMRQFHERLSEQTVYSRFLRPFNLSERTTHERLTRVCFIDYDREIALLALSDDSETSEVLAIGRLKKNLDRNLGSLSLIVTDSRQNQGLGKELIRQLIKIAKDENISHLSAFMDSANDSMKNIFIKFGFSFESEGRGFRVQLKI